jgi:hypothetical protein
MKKHDERQGETALAPAGAIQSHGEDAAKAYARGQVAPRPLNPTMEMETVWIEDAKRMPPPGSIAKVGSGPRNPDQRAPLTEKKGPSIELPAGLPVTKLQPIVIDPELLAEWRAQCAAGAGATASASTDTEPTPVAWARAGAAATAIVPATVASAGAGALAVGAAAQPRIVVNVETQTAAARGGMRSALGGRAKAAWMIAAAIAASGAIGAIGVRCSNAGRAARMAESGAQEKAAERASAPAAAVAMAPEAEADAAPRGNEREREREAEEMGSGGARGAVSSVAVPSARRPAAVPRARPVVPAPRAAPKPGREPAQTPAAPATTTTAAPEPAPAINPDFAK